MAFINRVGELSTGLCVKVLITLLVITSFVGRSYICESFHPLAAFHTCYADDDERNAEELSHIERQSLLKGFLYLFRVLDEESGGEDVSEAQTEEIAGSYAFWMLR